MLASVLTVKRHATMASRRTQNGKPGDPLYQSETSRHTLPTIQVNWKFNPASVARLHAHSMKPPPRIHLADKSQSFGSCIVPNCIGVLEPFAICAPTPCLSATDAWMSSHCGTMCRRGRRLPACLCHPRGMIPHEKNHSSAHKPEELRSQLFAGMAPVDTP